MNMSYTFLNVIIKGIDITCMVTLSHVSKLLVDVPTNTLLTGSSATTIDHMHHILVLYISAFQITDSLISVVRKFTTPKYVGCVKEIRNLKNFSEKDFVFDLSQIP